MNDPTLLDRIDLLETQVSRLISYVLAPDDVTAFMMELHLTQRQSSGLLDLMTEIDDQVRAGRVLDAKDALAFEQSVGALGIRNEHNVASSFVHMLNRSEGFTYGAPALAATKWLG